MKAIILTGFGGADKLCSAELPRPVIDQGQVLIKVKSLSINPIDIKTREGQGIADLITERPVILGWDISGVVEESRSTSHNVGDEIFGMNNYPGHGKAYAEFVAAEALHFTLKPSNISHKESAAACLAALTAWQNLTVHYQVTKGDRILIHGGSGGVGHFAIQMAKYLGAYVVCTSSVENREFVLGLGADEHIDYKAVNFEDHINDVSFVLNTQNEHIAERSLKVVKSGGTIINIGSEVTEELRHKAGAKHINVFRTRVKSNGGDMRKIAELLETQRLMVYIDSIFDLDDMASAHQKLSSGKTVGKIVLTT